jgi:hypothetical protein
VISSAALNLRRLTLEYISFKNPVPTSQRTGFMIKVKHVVRTEINLCLYLSQGVINIGLMLNS